MHIVIFCVLITDDKEKNILINKKILNQIFLEIVLGRVHANEKARKKARNPIFSKATFV